MRYMVSKRFGVIELQMGTDGLYRDDSGTVWAIADYDSVDKVNRCGVGILSLPTTNPLTPACKVHDYMYSSKAYQVFHTRREADRYLEMLVRQEKSLWRKAAGLMRRLAGWFGEALWENERTK